MWVLFYDSGLKVSVATLNTPRKRNVLLKQQILFFLLSFWIIIIFMNPKIL